MVCCSKFHIVFDICITWGITSQLFNYFVWLRITHEGSVPEMSIWSIFLINSDLKWCTHLSRSIFFIFQLLCYCYCWWIKESARAYVAKSRKYPGTFKVKSREKTKNDGTR